jgi:hypothetical protein
MGGADVACPLEPYSGLYRCGEGVKRPVEELSRRARATANGDLDSTSGKRSRTAALAGGCGRRGRRADGAQSRRIARSEAWLGRAGGSGLPGHYDGRRRSGGRRRLTRQAHSSAMVREE